MYQNYIFDLYGTLLDIHTDETGIRVWYVMQKRFRDAGVFSRPSELRRQYVRYCREEMGRMDVPYPEIDICNVFQRLAEGKADRAWAEETAVQFRNAARVYCHPYRKTKKVLQELKRQGKKTWLLSNAQRVFTIPEMEAFGLPEYFDDIFISSDYGIRKPDPAFLMLLLEKHDLQKEDTVMIGNEFASDIRTADACGIDSIFINTGGYSRRKIAEMMKETDPAAKVRIIYSRNLEEILKEEDECLNG